MARKFMKQPEFLRTGSWIAPEKTENLPDGVQWVPGEGSGAWFHLSQPIGLAQNHYRILRWEPDGTQTCDRTFVAQDGFKIDEPYQFVHISHCTMCSLDQNGTNFRFKAIID